MSDIYDERATALLPCQYIGDSLMCLPDDPCHSCSLRPAIAAALRKQGSECDDLKAALVEARGDTYPQPKQGWQCFHCGEWFTTYKSAGSHFGASPDTLSEQINNLSNLLETQRQQYADKCLELIGCRKEVAHLELGAARPECTCRVCNLRRQLAEARNDIAPTNS